MDLQGKRVLVTGASRGFGRILAACFRRAGANVALVARDEAAIKALATELGGTGHPADLTDRDQVAMLIERIEDDGGPIDVLVNNAGSDLAESFLDHRPGDLDGLYQLNLVTPVQLCRQVIPGMLQRGTGHIVNISSLTDACPVPGLAAYSSSKAGLTHFTAGLRADLRGLPVRTTLVELGPMPTDMKTHVMDYEPTRRSFRRLYRTALLVDTPPEKAADLVVRAVVAGRRHVRLPRRSIPLALLAEAPRRMIELALTGVPHQPR